MSSVKSKPSDFTWRFNKKGEAILTGVVGEEEAFVIVVPEEIDGRPVVKIDDFAFYECLNARSVAFGASVRRIGWRALPWSRNLRVVSFGADVLPRLEGGAPRDADVRVVASPSGRVSIPNCADARLTTNEALRAQTRDGALFSADGKTLIAALEPKVDYVVPDGVETIEKRAFDEQYSLRKITFPSSVRKIEDWAFLCSGLRCVALRLWPTICRSWATRRLTLRASARSRRRAAAFRFPVWTITSFA